MKLNWKYAALLSCGLVCLKDYGMKLPLLDGHVRAIENDFLREFSQRINDVARRLIEWLEGNDKLQFYAIWCIEFKDPQNWRLSRLQKILSAYDKRTVDNLINGLETSIDNALRTELAPLLRRLEGYGNEMQTNVKVWETALDFMDWVGEEEKSRFHAVGFFFGIRASELKCCPAYIDRPLRECILRLHYLRTHKIAFPPWVLELRDGRAASPKTDFAL